MTRFAILAALLASCSDTVDELRPISGPGVDYQAIIGPIEPYGVRGTSALVVSTDGESFSASIDIGGAVPGSMHPWHVHDGACGDGGGIVGQEIYPALAVDENGAASASASVAFALVPSVRYSVNVHLAASNLQTIIACGDYVFEGMGGQ